jgi:hypothetical protein
MLARQGKARRWPSQKHADNSQPQTKQVQHWPSQKPADNSQPQAKQRSAGHRKSMPTTASLK